MSARLKAFIAFSFLYVSTKLLIDIWLIASEALIHEVIFPEISSSRERASLI